MKTELNPNTPNVEACGDAIFNCGDFYSRDQINSYTTCCSKYEFSPA